MGRKRKGRALNGILLLDKPIGVSSNHALQKVRRLFNAAKAGHTGSLDPLASGMLPVCFGEATKFSQFLLDADKVYEVTGLLGVTTSTADAEGEVIEKQPVDVSLSQLTEVVESFIGDSLQVPSMFSALKHQGQPLYKLARQGIEVEREARPIHISSITINDIALPHFSLTVASSKGTYIRNLIEDIGKKLGCGAHVTQLRRISVAHFSGHPMVSMEQLEALHEQHTIETMDNLLYPMDEALHGYPVIELESDSAAYFCQGQAVNVTEKFVQGLIRVYDCRQVFLGVGQFNEDLQLAPKRLVAQSE